MTLYAAHSRAFDFENEWYAPLRQVAAELGVQIVLPHEDSDAPANSVERMKTFDLMLAEVSFPSTGLGIELGWASALGIPIVLVHRADVKVSEAVTGLSDRVIVYANQEELKAGLVECLKRL